MLLAPGSSGVIAQGENQENQEEEQARNHHELAEFFAGAFEVHEEQSNQNGLESSNGQSYGGVKAAEVEEGGPDRETGAREQRDPDAEVQFERR